MPNNIIIVDKLGTLKIHVIKEYKEEELYKKCGLKKPDGFIKQTEWNVKCNGEKYYIHLYGKLEGNANMENKYDFPPPVDNTLFFGSCILVGFQKDAQGNKNMISLTLELWSNMYEKMFGGFEDLTSLALENADDDEEDELDVIPNSKKTKVGGYLKDGFVVDDEEECDEEDVSDIESSSAIEDPQLIEEILDIGSEISEEEYEYSDSESDSGGESSDERDSEDDQ